MSSGVRTILMWAAALAAAVLAVPAAGDEDTEPKWRSAGSAGPAPRALATTVWDTKKDRIILFGGLGKSGGNSVMHSDAWTWQNSGGWKQVDASTPWPSSRSSTAAAFDEKHGTMWMFGGQNPDASARDDLWRFDTEKDTWAEVKVEGAKPSARFDAVLAYDPAGDRLVLFGGCTARNMRDAAQSDLWFFDIAKGVWSTKATTTPPRWQCASAFDAENGVLWVHGGFSTKPVARADLWSYSLKDDKWVQHGERGPTRDRIFEGHQIVWDGPNKRLVLHGGSTGDAEPWPDDLWAYDTKEAREKYRWKKIEAKPEGTSGPGSRAFHRMLLRPADKHLYVVGGSQRTMDDPFPTTEVWELSPGN